MSQTEWCKTISYNLRTEFSHRLRFEQSIQYSVQYEDNTAGVARTLNPTLEWQGERDRGAQATRDMLEAFGALDQRRAGTQAVTRPTPSLHSKP